MLNNIAHICIAVKNVEKTAQMLAEKFSIGPFKIEIEHYASLNSIVRGKPSSTDIKFGYAKIGNIVLEIAETIKGDTVLKEYIEQHGEGIHHIGFPATLPFSAEMKKWNENGIEALQIAKVNKEEGWAYMDTQKMIGFIVEILCLNKYQ